MIPETINQWLFLNKNTYISDKQCFIFLLLLISFYFVYKVSFEFKKNSSIGSMTVF